MRTRLSGKAALAAVWAVAAAALTAGPARAGDEMGNGGDVVYCDVATQPRTRMLDYYYATDDLRVRVDLGPAQRSAVQKVAYALDRLARLDPYRAQLYRSRMAHFFENALIRPIDLVDIPDSNHIFIPHGCRVRQIAIQKAPVFPHERLYTIDESLYNDLDNDNKATLLLHEIVYGEAIALGQRNSVKTRYYTAHLISDLFARMTIEEYRAVTNLVGFSYRPPQSNSPCAGVRVPGDYVNLRAALTALNHGEYTICLKSGVHEPLVFQGGLYGKYRIIGESPDTTVIGGLSFGSFDGTVSIERLTVAPARSGSTVVSGNIYGSLTLDRIKVACQAGGVGLDLSGYGQEGRLVLANTVVRGCDTGLLLDGRLDAAVVNNLFHENETAFRYERGTNQLRYANNLFVANDKAVSMDGSVSYVDRTRSSRNAFEFNGVNFYEAARPLPGELFDSLELDLDAVPARPLPGSRLIGAGLANGAPEYDYFGRARGEAPDVGPVQVGGVAPE